MEPVNPFTGVPLTHEDIPRDRETVHVDWDSAKTPLWMVDEAARGCLVRYDAYEGILYLWHDGGEYRARLIRHRQITDEIRTDGRQWFIERVEEMLSKIV